MDMNRVYKIFLLFLLCVSLFSKIVDARVRCVEKERLALLKFKKDSVDDYDLLSSWGSGEECCKWWGVECRNTTGHVIVLDLHMDEDVLDLHMDIYSWIYSRRLRGEVSDSLSELQHLHYLDLSGNAFNGSLKGEVIGSLHRLKYLNLSNNDFSGVVPHQIGNLTNLQTLDLGFNFQYYFNNVGLTTKNVEWLSQLRFLRHLDLSEVNVKNVTNWVEVIFNLPFLQELHLQSCGLGGVVPSSSLLLLNSSSESLSILDLSYNDLTTSSTYYWLFNVSNNLVSLSLNVNHLEGLIPDVFGEMVYLEEIDLSGNFFEGAIPKSFKNLSHLRSLDLSSNQNLNESFPELLKKLSCGAEISLESLELWNNNLYGPLVGITRFSSLKRLDLHYSQLNGSLLEDLFVLLSNLEYLDLSQNRLRGRIPESIGLLYKLEFLDLSSNFLEGTVSEVHFSELSNLKELYLSHNSLTLNMSSEWVPVFQLDTIILANCSMGPHFPKWLRTQNNISSLDLSSAGISSVLPNWFGDLFPNLKYLDLSSNSFSGPILSIPPNLATIYLNKNRFVGSLSFMCSLNGSFLKSLDLSDNLFSGDLSSCWMNINYLVVLNLGNNNFSSQISNSLGYLNNLESLHLRNNAFVGKIPSSLGNCTQLKVLDIRGNKLTGNIPTWIGTHLTGLLILSLRLNKFTGNIPQSICHLSRIQLLDLSVNDITGKIPHCFNNFTSLAQKDIFFASQPLVNYNVTIYNGHFENGYTDDVLVQWKNQDSEFKNLLQFQKTIDFSSNKLVGQIPQAITSLKGLISLNLSANDLTGQILEHIDEMEMLESLDLSGNHLSGEIPTGLARLNFLNVLNLSYNNLSGKIPSSTQLQSFNASSYIGNNGLCGPPLEKCSSDAINPQPSDHEKNNNDENEDEIVSKELYISIGVGFIVGLCGVFITLFKESWRIAYLRFVQNTSEWLYVTSMVYTARLKRMLFG